MAGILGGLASYTKFLGIVLFPSIIIEWWLQYKKINLYTLKKAIPILLIPLGLLIYANYLSDTKGDPLAFYKAQQLFGQERSITKIVLIYQVFWRYVKMLFTVNRSDFIFITVILELVTGIIFSITTIYSLIRQRKSYAIYNLLMYIIPTLTGSFTSLSRYVLLCFPSFMILGQAYSNASSINKKIISLAMGLAFVIFLTMFVRGYWLA
jgi:hypothetical protein